MSTSSLKIHDEEKLEHRHDDDVHLKKRTAAHQQSTLGSLNPFRSTKLEYASAFERRLVKKLDARILPLVCLLYLFAYLDRTNLGNARLQGLAADVLHGDPTGVLFDWVNSAFFFSYILCQIPVTICSKLVSPRIWLGCAAMGWAVCSTLMASGFDFPGLIVARVGLGVFEAGFGPVVPIYLSLFYTKSELGLRMAYWFGFAAVAGAFGGLVAFGVQHAHSTVGDWRLLFIIEGIPAFALGALTVWLLPGRPEKTSFLTAEERALAVERMNRGTRADVGKTVNKKHIFLALKDWKIYVGGVIYFALNCALASISAFLPTILTTLGFQNATAQLLTVPPYACAALVLAIASWASDRLQLRGPLCAAASTVAGIGYVLLLTVQHNVHVRYFGVFCITSGTYLHIGLIISWFAHNLASETKKATGVPMFMAIGQCGSVLGSHIFPLTEKPEYIRGFAVSCALQFVAAICAALLSFTFSRENKRRDRVYGVQDPDEPVDTTELADATPGFRYLP